jgi:hypothetical protein
MKEMHVELIGKSEGRDQLRDLDVNDRTVVQLILKK